MCVDPGALAGGAAAERGVHDVWMFAQLLGVERLVRLTGDGVPGAMAAAGPALVGSRARIVIPYWTAGGQLALDIDERLRRLADDLGRAPNAGCSRRRLRSAKPAELPLPFAAAGPLGVQARIGRQADRHDPGGARAGPSPGAAGLGSGEGPGGSAAGGAPDPHRAHTQGHAGRIRRRTGGKDRAPGSLRTSPPPGSGCATPSPATGRSAVHGGCCCAPGASWGAEQRIYVLRTSVDAGGLESGEVVSSDKALTHVERAFHPLQRQASNCSASATASGSRSKQPAPHPPKAR
jgi:hypothetical protein